MRKSFVILTFVLASCASTTPISEGELHPPQPDGDVTSSAAVGTAAVPIARWLGRVILRLVTNTTINVDIKKAD
jgi:hypothetical protein